MEKRTVGRQEAVCLPELNLFDLDAKVDTGADSCALHCDHIEIDAEGNVHFTLLDEVHPAYNGRRITMPLHKTKKIKSSNGEVQNRPFIKTAVTLFGEAYETEISLTNRSDMKMPMLIGRKLLDGRFLVDVSETYLAKGTPC